MCIILYKHLVFAVHSFGCIRSHQLGLWHTFLWHSLHALLTYLIFTHLTAAFNISLELQGTCSDQLTLICRHSPVPTDPSWIHNGTAEAGASLSTAFPGSNFSFHNNTENRVTVTAVDDVAALDGYVFQCVYSILGTTIKSNAEPYSFVPSGQSHAQYIACLIQM